MRKRFLIDHDPTEQDLVEMAYWCAVRDFEVQRVANVLAYWQREVRP